MVNRKINKKGWLRIVEASIGILVILGVLAAVSFNRETEEADPSTKLSPYLNEMAKDQDIRNSIIVYDLKKDRNDPGNALTIVKLNEFFNEKINKKSYNLNVSICKLDELCPLEPYPVNFDGNIISAERVVSGDNEEGFTPRKVKVFLWRTQN